MTKIEGLTEYDFKNWLIKNGVDLSIVEHETFKKDGILSYLLSNVGIESLQGDSNPWVTINDKEKEIRITHYGEGKKTEIYVFIPLDRFIPTFGNDLLCENGKLSLGVIQEKETNGPISSDDFKVLGSIEVGISKNNLLIYQGSTYMNKNNLRIERRGKLSYYDSDGIEFYHEKRNLQDFKFVPDYDKTSPSEIGEEILKATFPYYRKSGIPGKIYDNFMKEYKRSDFHGINKPISLESPDYLERARREQYDVANVYIENKQSRFYPDKKDIVYRGYMPIDNRDLVEMGSMYGPFGSFYTQTEFFETPEIPSKTEEQIKRDIENLNATEKQKAALYDMAVKQNRTEFSYSYLDDPKYTDQNGKGK